jgi:spermidine/putrescine transport system substrate-binding protein
MMKTRSPFAEIRRRRFLGASAAAAIGIALRPARASAAEEKQLNVYNWDTYIGEKTLDTFTERTGIKVQYDLYANNEEMFAKLKAGNPGYDIIIPSDYMVETMIKLGMLVPLDHSKIPNIKNIAPQFRDLSYDPGLKHCVPYMWGTVGIGYRKSKVQPTPDSWKAIFDSDQYSQRLALLADQRVVLGLAMKYLGYPLNSTDPAQIAEARDLLIKQKPHIKAFAPDQGQDMLLAGDVDMVMEWSGDIIHAAEEDEDIGFSAPKEGTYLWVDGACIPTGAPHPENAHAFLNHIHDPEVNADIANTTNYPTSNEAARPYLKPENLNNPAIYPPAEVVAKSEGMIDVGDATRHYDEAWIKIQAA